MPARNKTTETQTSVSDFINGDVTDQQKKNDAFQLVEFMSKWSGFDAKMWGSSIIGFGSYHYKYASGREGEMPLISFSPRKAEFSLYVYSPTNDNKNLLEKFGKYKISKACIYIKKLSDIDLAVLEEMCSTTIEYLRLHHECASRTNN